MKNLIVLILLIFSSFSWSQEVTLYLIGDSTMANKKDPDKNPEHGWGQVLPEYFNHQINIDNHAVNGRSSKSFMEEGRWEKVLNQLKPGDYVFIQFGHNDQKFEDAKRYTNPFTAYKANLRTYVNESREKGAIPILFSSIVRRNFNEQGVLIDTHGEYPLVAYLVAQELEVPFVDLQLLSEELVLSYGQEESKKLYLHIAPGENAYVPEGRDDDTHLSDLGAHKIAELALQEIANQRIPLMNWMDSKRIHLPKNYSWRNSLNHDDKWYQSREAEQIATNVLLYQKQNGGWQKNIDMSLPLSESEKNELIQSKAKNEDTTIDNGATVHPIRFLAKMEKATSKEEYRVGIKRGIDYLLAAQYKNGGWPQFYPLQGGYYDHITFNDNAMIGVMNLLKDVCESDDYAFLDKKYKTKSSEALKKGEEIILKTQIIINKKPTIWCAQYDEQKLTPAKARAYELPSLSGSESVGIVYYLMNLEDPNERVKSSITSAVEWFEDHKILGKKVVIQNKGTQYVERRLIDAEGGPALWARFYDLKTQQPIYVGRDGIIHSDYNSIEKERRNGYSYISDYAGHLLEVDYPKWKEKYK